MVYQCEVGWRGRTLQRKLDGSGGRILGARTLERSSVTSDVLTSVGGGLACTAGDFVIDPVRPTETSVVTHAHADHARPGAKVVHCSEEGALVTRRRVGDAAKIVTHAWGAPFRLGDAVVSLHPAGHIRGSAQVRVEVEV